MNQGLLFPRHPAIASHHTKKRLRLKNASILLKLLEHPYFSFLAIISVKEIFSGKAIYFSEMTQYNNPKLSDIYS